MANDELEMKLAVEAIYSRLYNGESRTVDSACDAAGISRGTFANWRRDKSQVVDQIRGEVYQRIVARRREDEEALEAEKHAAKVRVVRRAYSLIDKALDREEEALDNPNTKPFIIDSITKTILNLVRDEFDKEKSKIVINNGNKDDDGPPQLPAHRPFQALPDPSKIKPATDVQLAREKVEQKFVDGTQRLTVTEYPQVIENERPSE
jgi:hypothetical protein